MSFDTFVTIVCFAVAVVSYAAYRYCSENVYLKFKEQGGPKK